MVAYKNGLMTLVSIITVVLTFLLSSISVFASSDSEFDLAVTDIEAVKQTVVQDGIKVDFNVTVKNLGNVDSPKYCLDKRFGDKLITTLFFCSNPDNDALKPDESKVFELEHAYAAAGKYNVRFEASARILCEFIDGKLECPPNDANTLNNAMTKEVAVITSQTNPDLTITSIKTTSKIVPEGKEVTFNLSIKNIGGVATIDYMFSYDFGDGSPGGGSAVPLSIASLESKVEELKHVYKPGMYEAIFETGTTGDADTSNNKITKKVAIGEFDLAVTGIQVVKQTPVTNGIDATFRVAVKNLGKIDSPPYCLDKRFGDEQWISILFCSNPDNDALKPDESKVFELEHAYAAAGKYNVRFEASARILCEFIDGKLECPPNDANTLNNAMTKEVAVFRLLGDGNMDCVVNSKDLRRFNVLLKKKAYDQHFDFNNDGVLNILDQALIGKNFGKKC